MLSSLVFEFLDLTRLEAAAVRLQFYAHNLHQEIQAEDVNDCHGKDRGIREVDDRSKACGGPDDDEDTENDL